MNDEWDGQLGKSRAVEDNSHWYLDLGLMPKDLENSAKFEPQCRSECLLQSTFMSMTESRLSSVLSLCKHYEEKFVSQYADGNDAARCIVDLSRELQLQLRPLLANERTDVLLPEGLSGWDNVFDRSSELNANDESLDCSFSLDRYDRSDSSTAKVKDFTFQAEKQSNENVQSYNSSPNAISSQKSIDVELSNEIWPSGEKLDSVGCKHHKSIDIQESNLELQKIIEIHKKKLDDVQLELINNSQHMKEAEALWQQRLEEAELREKSAINDFAHLKEQYERLASKIKEEESVGHESLIRSKSANPDKKMDVTVSVLDDENPALNVSNEAEKLKLLTDLLEESKKEARWLKERSCESERVIEALRKTIMRQAELSSQRENNINNNANLYCRNQSNRHQQTSVRGRSGHHEWHNDKLPVHHRSDRDQQVKNQNINCRPPAFRVPPQPLHISPHHHHDTFFGDTGMDRGWSREGHLSAQDAPDRSRSAPLPEHQQGANNNLFRPPSPWGQLQNLWDRPTQREHSPSVLTTHFPTGQHPFPEQTGYGGGYLQHQGGNVPPLYPPFGQIRSTSSPNLPGNISLGGGGGLGGLGITSGNGMVGGHVGLPSVSTAPVQANQSMLLMRIPQPRQPSTSGLHPLSRVSSNSSTLDLINEDVNEFLPGAEEVNMMSSYLSGF